MLKGRHGVGWMIAAWVGLATLLVVCVWTAIWIGEIIL